MISFDDITKLFSLNLQSKLCVEIEFLVKGYSKYQSCWMGKMPNKDGKEKEIYWFGLKPDNSKAYDYDNFKDFSSAPVFNGKSLNEVWNCVKLISIDGCDPEDRIQEYLKNLF